LDIRNELEADAPVALATMQSNEARGMCLTAKWVPRADLPLRAYRAYEVRRNASYSYSLSPHIVTRGDDVVFFSMGVVRQSAAVERLGLSVPDPAERVCCVTPFAVGGCSRYGGPDPYQFHVRGLRAVHGRMTRQ
jgi:hypothetical protein